MQKNTSSGESGGDEQQLKADLAARVPGLEQLAEIPGVVPRDEQRVPAPGEPGFEAVFGSGAPRPVGRREFWLALLFFLIVGAIPLRRGLASSERVLFGLDRVTTILPWSAVLGEQVAAGELKAQDLGPKNRGLSDQAVNFYPFYRWVARSYLEGDAPWWNPLIYCGAPALGNPQAGVLDPQVALLVAGEALGGLSGFHYALSLAALLRLFLAGFGAFLLARRLGLGGRGALLAGLSFQFSGYMILWLNFPLAHVPPFLPWVLYFVEGLLGRGPGETSPWPRRRAFVGAVLAMLLAVLGGHPETSFFVGLTAGLWCLAILLRDRRAGLLGLLALLLGSLAASPVLLAFWSYLSVSGAQAIRSAAQERVALELPALLALAGLVLLLRLARLGLQGPPERRAGPGWSAALSLLGMLVILAGGLFWFLGHGLEPRFFLSFVHDLWGQPGRGEGYLGMGTSLLESGSSYLITAAFVGALASLFAGAESACLRRRGLIIAAAGVSFALAIGLPGPLELYRQLPLIGLGDTVRLAPIAALMLGLLAGEGLERAPWLARLAGLLGVATLVGVTPVLAGTPPPPSTPAPVVSTEADPLFGVYLQPGPRLEPRQELLEGWFDGRLAVTGVRLHLEREGPDGASLETLELPFDLIATPTVAGVEAPDGARFFRCSAFQTSRLVEGWWRLRLDFLGSDGVVASRELGRSLHLRELRPRLVTLVLMLLAGVAFVFGRRAALPLLTISLIQALSFAEGQNPDYPAAAVFPETRTEAILARELGPWRYFSDYGVLPPDTGLVHGLASLDGYDAIDPLSYNLMRSYALGPHVHPLLGWNARGADLQSPIFRMLGVKCLVLRGPLGDVPGAERWQLIAQPEPRAPEVEAAETWIYRARDPWPRAWCVVRSTGIDEVEADVAAWDPRTTALVNEPWTPAVPAKVMQASVPEVSNTEVRVEVALDGDALLILSEQYFASSWFEVDGQRRAARQVNGLFIGVELSSGDREVVLHR